MTGAEGMVVGFLSLLQRPEFETYVGLLGYPVGFLLVLDVMRRSKVSLAGIAFTAVMIIPVSAIVFYLIPVASVGLSEY